MSLEMNELMRAVVFCLDGQRYALPLAAVRRIVRAVEVTPLPGAPAIVLGAIDDHRGEKMAVRSVFQVAAACLCCVLLIGGCATGPGASAYIWQAEQEFSRGDDVGAFTSYSNAIDSANQPASQAALAAVRASPRLLTVMDVAIERIRNPTAVGNVTREEYVRELSLRSEVGVFFKVRQLDAQQQEQFYESAWRKASVLVDQVRVEAERARVRERAALAALAVEAEEGSRVRCGTESECRKAFALAQIYVSTKTDMKIQLATDTIIETYNPTESGKMGAKVIKTPGAGQSAEIVLTVACRECSDPIRRDSLVLMREFRRFVEVRLKQ